VCKSVKMDVWTCTDFRFLVPFKKQSHLKVTSMQVNLYIQIYVVNKNIVFYMIFIHQLNLT